MAETTPSPPPPRRASTGSPFPRRSPSGRVNVYLIDDDPLTLVDAGPNSGTSFDELQRGIAGLGHRLEDIELVILTHQHIDHLGLVVARGRRTRRGGGGDRRRRALRRELLLRGPGRRRLRHRHHAPPRHPRGRGGGPAVGFAGVSGLGGRASRSPGPCATGRRWPSATARCTCSTARATPPPTRSSTTATAASSSPPTICSATSRPTRSSRARATGPASGPQALVQYLESLAATREMDVDLVLPGHGDPVTDHRSPDRPALQRSTAAGPTRSTACWRRSPAPRTSWPRRCGATSRSPRPT